MKENKEKKSFIIRLGDFITKFRYLFLVVFVILSIFFAFKINDVSINNSIVDYLPNNTETKNGIEIMDKEFGKLTTIQLMVEDISKEEAGILYKDLSKIENVDNIIFSDEESNYKDSKALFTINLIDKDKKELNNVKNDIEKVLDGKTFNLYSEGLLDPTDGVGLVLLLVVIVITVILFATSKSWFAPIIAFIVFGISIILNMGTNYLLGDISYITESIAVVLQLALSIDYVIIFMNQYMKEINDTNDKLLAIKKATSKSIPEIFASSLTTISGLLALIFMQLRIGGDIGVVLSKGILFSLLTVILLMPSLLFIFNKIILKWKKKEKPKKELKLSNFIVNKRKVLLSIFSILLIVSAIVIPKYQYVYNLNTIKSVHKNTSDIALQNIEDTFGKDNTLVVLVKNKDKEYQKELKLAEELQQNSKITSITNIGNYSLGNNITLGKPLNYKEFSKVFNIDEQLVFKLYSGIAIQRGIGDIYNYEIPLIDMIYLLHDNNNMLNDELKFKINTYYQLINNNLDLLESDNYSRMILNIDVDVEGEETKELIDYIRTTSNKYYDEVTLVGNSINAIDLESSFTSDNLKITLITVLFIAIILLFTFKNIPLTLLLILTIEGSILINFGLMTLLNQKIFFMTYVVVSAIQMGATIDYAIVLASRYKTLRNKMDKKEALINTLNDSLPTISTSGLILLIAGIIVGCVSTSPVISSIGIFLAVGTTISLIGTIFVLPAILYLFDKFIIKK